MAASGPAAMALSFSVDAAAVTEHDRWHAGEHLAERLSIPGFWRGTRWRSAARENDYFVVYEVDSLDVLESPEYLARLNRPSAWTAAMMTRYRGMRRGLCRIVGRSGCGLGYCALLVRLAPQPGRAAALRDWLTGAVLPSLPARDVLVSGLLLETALAPSLSEEQRIRGKDAGVNWLLLVTGYSDAAIARLAGDELARERLAQAGALDPAHEVYLLQQTVQREDAAPSDRS